MAEDVYIVMSDANYLVIKWIERINPALVAGGEVVAAVQSQPYPYI